MNMLSYQYMDSDVDDKTVSRPSYSLHGNPHSWERRSLYWDEAQVACHWRIFTCAAIGYMFRPRYHQIAFQNTQSLVTDI